jgi:hypothetical protein
MSNNLPQALWMSMSLQLCPQEEHKEAPHCTVLTYILLKTPAAAAAAD